MTESGSTRSPHRLAPGPFLIAVGLIYLASFTSQMLLSPPVTSRLNVAPFVLLQAVLIVLWLKVHIFRLRDAGRRTGGAFAVAILYALEVVIFAILVAVIVGAAGTNPDGGSREPTILHLLVVLYFFSLMTNDPGFGALQIWMHGFVAVMLLPIVIGVIYSIWVATRPRVP